MRSFQSYRLGSVVLVRRLLTSRGGTLTLMATMLAVVGGCGSAQHHDVAASTIIVGRGSTLSGKDFVVSITHNVKRLGGAGTRGSCPISVTITETGYASFGEVCFSRMSAPVRPKIDCIGGERIIHVEASQDTRFVTLVLSNGRTVTSRVIHLPVSLGGPAELYFQAMPASGPRPTRLLERGGNGRVVGVLTVVPSWCKEPLV